LSRSKHHQILISSRGELPEFATMYVVLRVQCETSAY